MNTSFEPLFTPFRVGNVEIKNRIVMLPMEGTNMIAWEAKTGFVKGIENLYRDRKDNNVGLFIPGLIPLVSIVGERWVYKHPEVFEPVKPIVREIHESGAKIFFQLSAGSGRSMLLPPVLRPFVKKGLLKKASSKVVMSKWWYSAPDPDEPNVWDPDVKMDVFTDEMISRFIYAFGQTALRCKEAGVDGVEIHAVHEGYLLDQFAMKYTNHRTDPYGGSLENRLRFACEIVREIKKVCGDDFPVSLRYSVCSMTRGFNQGAVPGEEFEEVGRDLAESERAVKILEDAGYDMFNCDNGTYDAWYWAHPPVYAPLNLNLSYVEHIKQFTTKPVVCAGRLQPDAAAASIAAGRIDAMGVGRQLLCDPEYVTKIKEGRLLDIRPCIACHGACLPFNGLNGKGTDVDPMHLEMGRCVLNPWTRNEDRYSKAPAKKPKKIAVVGGGLGGMEVAIQASLRGHKVDMYEKTDRLGGVFNAAAAMSFKEKDKELLAWYERQLMSCGAAVHMGTEVTDLAALDADIVVVAIGAKPKTLPIPGAEKAVTAAAWLEEQAAMGDKSEHSASHLLAEQEAVGDPSTAFAAQTPLRMTEAEESGDPSTASAAQTPLRMTEAEESGDPSAASAAQTPLKMTEADNVVIIGGGLTGCEIAYELALQGKHPVIVEMTGHLVGARGICMANSTMLRELLRYHKVPAYLNSTVESISDHDVVIKTQEGTAAMPADLVIMSVGYRPDERFKETEKAAKTVAGRAAGKALSAAGKAFGIVSKAVNAVSKGGKSGAAKSPKVYFVGDCDKVGSLKTVIKQAYELVQEISYHG